MASESMAEAVRAFHEKFGVEVHTKPRFRDVDLRLRLVEEEYQELLDSVAGFSLPDAADAIADLIYVLLGTAHTWGIPIEEVFAEVHRSNLAKEGGSRRKDGKILKPPGWEPPRIREILERYR